MDAQLYNALADLAEAQVADLKKNLKDAKKIASGSLYNSIRYEIKESNGRIDIKILANSYLINVDRGRGRGKTPPPYKPIEKWLHDKRIPIDGNEMKSRAGQPRSAVRGRGQSKPDQYKSAAIAIAKSIGKKGIAPYGTGSLFLKKSSIRSQNSKKAITNITQNLVKSVQKSLKGI